MPISATCTRGSVVVSRPLPSFVVMQTLPVSATPKLPPEMPMSALQEPGAQHAPRQRRHARRIGHLVVGRPAAWRGTSRATSCRLLWMIGIDDVRRMIVVELDDELAEVGLEHLDAGRRQRRR